MAGWSGEGYWLILSLVPKNLCSNSDVLIGQLWSTNQIQNQPTENSECSLCLRVCYEYTRQCDSLDFASCPQKIFSLWSTLMRKGCYL